MVPKGPFLQKQKKRTLVNVLKRNLKKKHVNSPTSSKLPPGVVPKGPFLQKQKKKNVSQRS